MLLLTIKLVVLNIFDLKTGIKMNSSKGLLIKSLSKTVLVMALVFPVYAEDTEIYSENAPHAQPNVLFVPDFSGSMKRKLQGSSLSRIESLRSAFKTVTSDESIKANMGILGFSGKRVSATGGGVWNHGVAFPVAPLDNLASPILLSNSRPIGTAEVPFTLDQDSLPDPFSAERIRDFLPRILDEWNPNGATPIVDAYYEAALYYRGEPSKWGQLVPHKNASAHPSSYRSTDNATVAVYKSPIGACNDNLITLLTDGTPNNNKTAPEISQMTGQNCVGLCATELADFLATKDQRNSIEGDNIVTTHTIGFDVQPGSAAETFMTSVAQAGGGEYFPANNAASFAEALKTIIREGSKVPGSFAAPVYTVDPSTRLANSRDIYIPLFEKINAPRWSGNLKKFKLNAVGEITDKTGKVAVSADGVLDPEAQDFWSTSPTPQGNHNAVTSGGVANLLVPGSRNLLTDDGASLVALDSSSLNDTLLKFIQGSNSDGTPRNHLGDILHSKPSVVSYSNKEVIFFGTNEGYLHAINTADASSAGGGKELFAFMPSPLVSTIQEQYVNVPLTGPIKRIYGVDGEMTIWLNDKNKNGKVEASDGDKAYLYFGLRRGGSAYYALDITNPSKPRLLWTIDDRTHGFERLGQTWSKPTLGKLRYKDSGTVKFEEVLVFGGGYDASVYDEENTSSRSSQVKGNSVYIVTAKTGTHIWSYDDFDLNDSVPSSIHVLDVDRNGSIDRLYFGDVGGNVWRVDLNIDDIDDDASMHDVKQDARIYKFASLGDNSGGDKRKFFHKPDVTLFTHANRPVVMVTLGSGYRSHPNNTNIRDRFYVLYDENVISMQTTPPSALTENDLTTPAALAGKDFLPDYKGWYKDLVNNSGEKVLSTPLIFMGKVMFTTFGLTREVDECTLALKNESRVYVLDLLTGSSTADLDGDGVVTPQDESVIVGVGEIPETPQLIFNQPTNCTEAGCDHLLDIRVGKRAVPIINGDTEGGGVNLGEYLPKVYWLDKES